MLRDIVTAGSAPYKPETMDIYTPSVWRALGLQFKEQVHEFEAKLGVRRGELTCICLGQACPDLLTAQEFLDGGFKAIEFHIPGRFDLKEKKFKHTAIGGKVIANSRHTEGSNRIHAQFKKTSGVDGLQMIHDCMEKSGAFMYSHWGYYERDMAGAKNSRVLLAYTMNPQEAVAAGNWKGGTRTTFNAHKRFNQGVERHFNIAQVELQYGGK